MVSKPLNALGNSNIQQEIPWPSNPPAQNNITLPSDTIPPREMRLTPLSNPGQFTMQQEIPWPSNPPARK